MMFDLIIHSDHIFKNNTFVDGTIGIKGGTITYLGSRTQLPSLQSLDARHLHIIPGVIDSQVHFREPGFEYKEDLFSGSKSALRGGITGVFEMPNTNPPTTSLESFQQKMDLAKNRMWVDYGFYIGATANNLKELKELELEVGCPGVKIFVGSSTGNLLLTRDEHIETVFKTTHKTIALHCEDEDRLQRRKQIAIDAKNPIVHPIWRDELVAVNATKRIVELARKHNRKVHILHVSSLEEMEFLRENKDITTVETTPQHLTLFAPDCYETLGTLAQMNPPIRTKKHYEALWKAIQNGTVDVLGSDHAPHTLAEKQKTYPSTPSGMPGVQTLIPLMLDHVNQGRLSLERFVELVSTNPLKIFKIKNRGELLQGQDATLTIFDLKETRKIESDWLISRAGWCPFVGTNIQGWPRGVILHGKLAMWQDEILDNPSGCPFQF